MANERVLVTGASGLLGCALMEQIAAQPGVSALGVTSKVVDLRDFSSTCEVFKNFKPTIVYHLAGRVSGIMGNIKAQGQAYFDNATINSNVVEASRVAGATKVVAMGSVAAYPDAVTFPITEDQLWSGPPHGSEFGYAHAKRGMLAQLESYHSQYGLDYAFCLSTNLFGPHDKFDEKFGHVIPSLLSKFLSANQQNKSVTVWGTGTPERDFLYSKDAAAALLLIGEKYTGAINLATENVVTIAQAVQLIADVSGFKGQIEWDSSKPDGQKLRRYDTSRLTEIGFSPKFTLRAALQETYDWLVANEQIARR